tara:strand:+ start:189 stop:1106 length:918 start_codon:yes stop_codon:yes gene_type:complete
MFDRDKLNFEVEKFPLQVINESPDGTVFCEELSSNIGVGIRRKDTREPLAIVKDSYEIVQYISIVDQIEEALNLAGLDLTDAEFTTNVYDSGAKIELTAKFPAHAQDIDGKGLVVPQFKFRTSQDGTWANNGMMGLFRFFCFNTLITGNKLAYVYGRHTKNFSPVSFGAKIRTASEYIAGDGLARMNKWFNTPLKREDAIQLFTKTLAKRTDNVTRKNVGNKVMLSNLMKTFDEENRHVHGKGLYEKYGTQTMGSLWTAYQAATAWSSHVTNGKAGSRKHVTRVNREDRVRKMLDSSQWLELEAA